MIKYILSGIVILALIGGAVQFKSTDKDWSLVVDKEVAKISVYNGVVKIYNFSKELFNNAVKNTDLTLSEDNSKS